MPVNKIFILYFIASIHSAFCTNDGVKDENNNIVLKSIKKKEKILINLTIILIT